MMIPLLYLLFLPILITVVAISMHTYKDYSFKYSTLSMLGTKKAPYHKAFNFSFIIYGILTLLFVSEFQKVLPESLLTNIGLILLSMSGIFCALVGLIPVDKNKSLHSTVSAIAFLSIFGAAITLLLPVIKSNLPNHIVTLNILVILTSIVLVYGVIYKAKHSRYILYFCLWEWIGFFTATTAIAMVALTFITV